MAMSGNSVTTKVIRIREMTKDEVRREVVAFFQKKETTDFVEMFETFQCPFALLREVLDDLKAEGLVSVVGDE